MPQIRHLRRLRRSVRAGQLHDPRHADSNIGRRAGLNDAVQRVKSAARQSIISAVSPMNVTLLVALASSVLALLALRRRTMRTQRDLCSLLATTSELRHLADHDA